MSRWILVSLALGLIVSGIGAAGAASGATNREQELLAEIDKLRARVDVLEDKLKRFEARTTQPEPPLTFQWAPSVPQVVPRSEVHSAGRFPEGTVEREFNGMKYYIMPITADDTSPLTKCTPVHMSPAR